MTKTFKKIIGLVGVAALVASFGLASVDKSDVAGENDPPIGGTSYEPVEE
jgi:hypothetical protein